MEKLLLHVGMPKTATTTLQRHVFTKHPDLFAITMFGSDLSTKLCMIIDELNRTPLDKIAGIQTRFFDLFDRESIKSPVLISREDFTFPRKTDLETSPEKLKRTLGDAKIIYVVRQQFEWLQSYYLHHQRRHGSRKMLMPASYLKAESEKRNGGVLSVLDFADQLAKWEAAFGRENIVVIPFEMMKSDPTKFFRLFFSPVKLKPDGFVRLLAEAPSENQRFSMDDFHAGRMRTHMRKSAPILYQLSRLFRFDFFAAPSFDVSPATVNFRDALPQGIQERWSSQNASLAKRYQLNLKKYGYL
ncbi:MAG: sulfotransferase domain-containing protein [Rhizobiaceae bacterium]|nr:sulfotransferase domain-containing protein [Rhizobiaceae bacterium]